MGYWHSSSGIGLKTNTVNEYMSSTKIGGYTYQKSTAKGKKLMTKVDGKVIHFGQADMQHYRDKTGIWSEKDHNDRKRRQSYLARASAIKNKSGQLTKDDPSSPNYHAIRVLW